MGTRSLTYVYDERGTAIMCMYRQFDGYPTGHGLELANFLISKEIVNGYSLDQVQNAVQANGMGCLAAQMVAHFKNGVGGFYLYAPNLNQEVGQEYEYHVFRNVFKDKVKVLENNKDGEKIIFSGSWQEFRDFCLQDAE